MEVEMEELAQVVLMEVEMIWLIMVSFKLCFQVS